MAPLDVQIRLFGSPQVSVVGVPARLGRRATALLCHLTLQPQARAPRERLSGLLWPDRSEPQARASLRQCLFEVRRSVGTLVETDRRDLWLITGPLPGDWQRIETAIAAAAPEPLARALAEIGDAPLIEGVELGGPFDIWLQSVRSATENRLAGAVAAIVRAADARGDRDAALRLADQWLQRDPQDEGVAALAIAIERERGAQAAAQRRFQQLEQALRRDGLGPPGAVATQALRAPAGMAAAAAVTASPAPAKAPDTADSGPETSTQRPAGRPLAQRRQVTVASIALAAGESAPGDRDPEERLAEVDRFHAACHAAIAGHGGQLLHRQEGRLSAIFGWPDGHEEQAANAVRALLVVRDTLNAPDAAGNAPLKISGGVATGDVLVRSGVDEVRSPAESGLVGDPPALAEALARRAGAGRILLAASTSRICRGLFVEKAAEDTPQADGTREVLGASDVASQSQTRRRGEALLLGRARELALLRRCWELARSGDGQLVLVQGEAGIGKSRLVDAFIGAAGAEMVRIELLCGPNLMASSLAPVEAHVRRIAGITTDDGPGERHAKLLRLTATALPDVPQAMGVLAAMVNGAMPVEEGPLAAMLPERRRALILDTLMALLEGSTRDRPAIILAEDLHWADPTTLELLGRAARMVADRPWMILATARSEFSCDWADHADLVHLPVTGLPDAVCAEICAAIDQEGRLAPRHVAAIVARCDGNPLFVEEVVRATCEALAESGEAGDVALNAVPATLQDGLVSRLDRLGPAREVATVAAAAGREVDHGLLALVLDMPSRSLREGLRNLSRAGILEVEGVPPSSRYRFRHALIRDAAYGLLGTRAREAVHLRLAEALPLHAPDVAQRDPASLAGHLESAGHLARALPLWAAAASAAAAAGAHQEAAARYRAALSLLDRMEPGSDSPARRLELLAGLIVSLGAVDGWASAEVKALLDEARALFGSVGSASPPFPVLRGFVSFFIMAADHGSAATMAERCTAIATRTGSPEQLVNAHTSTGYLRWVAGDLQRARSELETAVSIYTGNESARATTMAAQDQLIQALGPLIDILRVTGEDAQALSRRQQLAEHLQRLGEASFNLASGRFWQAYDALGRGEAREALQLSAEGIALSERLSYRAVLYPLRFMHAAAEGLLGAPGDALAEMERMLDQTDRLGERHFRGNYLGLLAHLRAAAGQTEAALDAIDEAIAVTRAASELLILPRLLLVRAEILARAGPGEEAARTAALAEARRVAAAQGAHRLVTLADGTRGALF